MEIRRYEPNGRYSKVVEHNGILYISGEICSDPGADIKGQTRQVLEKIEGTLGKYGSDKNHLLYVTVFIKDMSLFREMNSVYDSWVATDNEPARVCVEAKLASPSILVEISCIAAMI